jgi:hypothetical protein
MDDTSSMDKIDHLRYLNSPAQPLFLANSLLFVDRSEVVVGSVLQANPRLKGFVVTQESLVAPVFG